MKMEISALACKLLMGLPVAGSMADRMWAAHQQCAPHGLMKYGMPKLQMLLGVQIMVLSQQQGQIHNSDVHTIRSLGLVHMHAGTQ
jgi:hypothetical protein